MSFRKKFIKDSGFSIPEVLIAIAVLGLFIVGSSGVITKAWDYAQRNQESLDRSALGNYFLQFTDCEKTKADPAYQASCLHKLAINIRDKDGNIILPAAGDKIGSVKVENICDAGEIFLTGETESVISAIPLLGGVPILCPPTISTFDKPIVMSLTFASAGKSLTIKLKLVAKGTSVDAQGRQIAEFGLDPGSLHSEIVGDFSKELRDQLVAGELKAKAIYDPNASSDQRYSFNATLAVKNLNVRGKPKGDQTFTMSSKGKTLNLENNEGDVKALETSEEKQGGCKIEKNGNQPKPNVHFVVLTKEAPCDFNAPFLEVTGRSGGTYKVPVGTTWVTTRSKSHSFPLTEKLSYKKIDSKNNEIFVDPSLKKSKYIPLVVDNGFLLAQPDGKVYLLADAGAGRATGSSTEGVAKSLIKSLKRDKAPNIFSGAGEAELLLPTAETTFKKGSVIAIYDDTPDMGGNINVDGITKYVVTTNTSLKWQTSEQLPE